MSLRKLIIFALFFLTGCDFSLNGGDAVVEDEAGKIVSVMTTKQHLAHRNLRVTKPHVVKKSRRYTVQKGDTVYSIAFSYGLDFRYLAKTNHLSSDFSIHPGERLVIPPELNLPEPNELDDMLPTAPKKQVSVAKITKHSPTSGNLPTRKQKKSKVAHHAADKHYVATSTTSSKRKLGRKNAVKSKHKRHKLKKDFKFAHKPVNYWFWPAKGKVTQHFSQGRVGNKGLDITGKYAEPIKAAANGRVVYSGSGLRGYGNLIIIKHNDRYLSAYAYNKELLVTEGTEVKAGQVIAKMGHGTNGTNMLHFEIRRNGKPVNPLRYIR